MIELKKEILNNGLYLYYNYLSHYGIDKYGTKKDLLLLSCINEILENNCHYDLIDVKSLDNIHRLYRHILHRNPQLKYCRKNLDNYNNLGDAQFIEKYQRIKNITQ